MKNQHQQPHPKVAESESIGANHLGFTKFLFQHYCQHLRLNYNHISAELAFNFYVNKRIAYLLNTLVNIESARETFYNELIQNTSLPTNHNFTSIITKINKKIKYHTQQRYPITYTSKGKEKLQTPTVIPQRIQPPTWKKTKVESPTNSLYYYTSESAINISSTEVTELEGEQEEEEEEEEEEESEDQKFTYQNPIPKNLEFKTPNVQTLNFQAQPDQNDRNPETINQLNLPSNIVINQPHIDPIAQPLLQQLIQQPIQHPQQQL
ncbi:hypothetical protein G9A89_022276 [Geosiphon pyriformis]|nr:hypothetical protein G9A89_022276 [Geosiphon pyriformis]